MEAKELAREIMDAERLAERGQLILQLHNQLQALQKENEDLKKQLTEKGDQSGNQTSTESGSES